MLVHLNCGASSPPVSPLLSPGSYPSSHAEQPIVPRPREGHRRRFSDADKTWILEEAARPGVSAADVARRYGIAERVLRRGSRSVRLRRCCLRGDHRCGYTGRGVRAMTALLPPGVKVHLALGYTDMRKGLDGLAMLVQGVLQQDPFSGHLFVFRGRTGRTSSRSCSGTGPACASSPSGLSTVSSYGRRSIEPGGTLIADFGAAVDADRGRRLALAGTAVATRRCRLSEQRLPSPACDYTHDDDRVGVAAGRR